MLRAYQYSTASNNTSVIHHWVQTPATLLLMMLMMVRLIPLTNSSPFYFFIFFFILHLFFSLIPSYIIYFLCFISSLSLVFDLTRFIYTQTLFSIFFSHLFFIIVFPFLRSYIPHICNSPPLIFNSPLFTVSYLRCFHFHFHYSSPS